MTNLQKCSRWLAWVGAAIALGMGSVHAQEDAGPAAVATDPLLSCGVVDARPAMVGYYSDLCRAFADGLGGAGVELSSGSSETVLRSLLDGSVGIALGLPWEGTVDAAVRHGPVVLVMPFGRFGIAARAGDDRRLDTVSWLFHALVEAEARGIGAEAVASGLETVPEAAASAFRNYERRLTDQLGLAPDGIRRMIETHGHHGEIYARWFDGPADANRPVELGGQLYAPPVSDR